MVDHVGRKITLIVALLAIALSFLLLKDPPFNLGLDLRGGTRMVYSFDFDQAVEDGTIGRNENRQEVLRQTIDIIRNRLDPTGTREASIRPEGTERIVIELPGTLGLAGDKVETTLGATLLAGETGDLTLADDATAEEFPAIGAKIRIYTPTGEFEDIRYDRREGNKLIGISNRGQGGTQNYRFEAGARVELLSDDAIRRKIENLGELSFLIVANDADFGDEDTDLASERTRFQEWRTANPDAPTEAFNRVPREQGGPHPRLWWFDQKETGQPTPVLRPPTPKDDFRGGDLSLVYATQDSLGYPAVGFEFKPTRKNEFQRFTRKNENRQMAIVLNDSIESAPTIDEPLPGRGIIRGRFKEQDVKDLIVVLRSGSLKIRPTLEHEEKVGATLGADYVTRGEYSGVLALVLVLAFMIVYYRGLGVYASAALAASFVILMGGLSFLNATLTLPGIAGIILTVGMAVDANILIFDRIREEMDKGRNYKQAAKTGFEMARSAILDANITTFLTGFILYNVGTGPVRGFAVTLMIGIVASVFSALVVTRVLVHYSLVRGRKGFSMGRLMVEADYKFFSVQKLAVGGSALLITGGLIAFGLLPEHEKYGIDFLGGTELQLRTAEAQDIDLMRSRIKAIPGLGGSAEVKPVLSTASGDGYREFRAVFKAAGTADAEEGERYFASQVKEALKDLLLNDPIQVAITEEGATANVTLHLLFEGVHPEEDVASVLETAQLSDVTVTRAEGRGFDATARTTVGVTVDGVRSQIEQAFRDQRDSNKNPFALAAAIPAATTVGPQVVGELRDKALLALVISMFVIVMYIRVRFAEYSYGFAAVAALLHDVLITLAVLSICNHWGIVDGEITLPMIAAFLTIIGYSLNDTIVIFDRVRENMPRMKESLEEVLRVSINQTLSRTILTSFTTFIAVAIMYVFNRGTGNVLESFSFAMMVGVITGTYSTIFIANPVLLWLEKRSGNAGHDDKKLVAKASAKTAEPARA